MNYNDILYKHILSGGIIVKDPMRTSRTVFRPVIDRETKEEKIRKEREKKLKRILNV
jgi:hypothetical protein